MEENHMGWKLVSGVRQDVVTLFKSFASTKSVRFEEFCKVWKEMKFFTIFSFRFVYIERLEFVEEIFHIVKNYLLSSYEFQTRIAALYTLYGLYFKQPLREPVKIRFTKPEWEDFQSLIATCKAEKHYDIVFIYLKMFLNNAFMFTATSRTVGLEIGFRKYFKQRYTLLPNHHDIELLYRPLLSEKLVSSLMSLEQLYCKKKLELLGKRNIEFIDTKFSTSLYCELMRYASKCQGITKDHGSQESLEFKKSDDKNLESNCESIKSKSSQPNQKGNEKNLKTDTTVKKRKLTRKYLLAKKKAEIYLKQLQENKEQTSQDDLQKTDIQLPEIDL